MADIKDNEMLRVLFRHGYIRCYSCDSEMGNEDIHMVMNLSICESCLNRLGVQINNYLKLCEMTDERVSKSNSKG